MLIRAESVSEEIKREVIVDIFPSPTFSMASKA